MPVARSAVEQPVQNLHRAVHVSLRPRTRHTGPGRAAVMSTILLVLICVIVSC
jgi:hypothetical protein